VKKKPRHGHDRKPQDEAPSRPNREGDDDDSGGVAGLRVIGGSLRHRKIAYTGDARTRPMKDRTREAIFNLLGDTLPGMLAVDLFAGTGALGIEALSRGAAQAVFFEKHFPTADTLRGALAQLGVAERGTVQAGDTFLHFRRMQRDGTLLETLAPDRPWVVFVSPPYDFFVDRRDEMLALVETVLTPAPPQSIVVVEADQRFDFTALPQAEEWRIREYRPAVVGLYRVGRLLEVRDQ